MQCQNARIEGGMVAFDCPHCNVSLSLDEIVLGQFWDQYQGKLSCNNASCGQEIIVPTIKEATALLAGAALGTQPAPVPEAAGQVPETAGQVPEVAASAEDKGGIELKRAQEGAEGDYKMGFHGSKGETLEESAKAIKLKAVKTFRHSDCQKDGKDTFDETVSEFLKGLEDEDVISVTPVHYSEGKDKPSDYGIIIVHKK